MSLSAEPIPAAMTAYGLVGVSSASVASPAAVRVKPPAMLQRAPIQDGVRPPSSCWPASPPHPPKEDFKVRKWAGSGAFDLGWITWRTRRATAAVLG